MFPFDDVFMDSPAVSRGGYFMSDGVVQRTLEYVKTTAGVGLNFMRNKKRCKLYIGL